MAARVFEFAKENWETIVSIALYFIPVVGPGLSLMWSWSVGMYYGGVRGAMTALASAGIAHGIGAAFAPAVGGGKAGFARAALSKAGANGPTIALAKATTHGIAQGGLAEIQGGDFGDGFLAAFSGSMAGYAVDTHGADLGLGKSGSGWDGGRIVARTTVSAVVGGTVAEIGGGKFANGAVTAAMVHLFNDEASHGAAQESKDHRIGIGVHFDGPDDKIGHAFVVLTTDEGRTIVRGFYPSALAGKDGLIVDDIGKYNDIIDGKAIGRIEYHDITQTQFRAATKTIVDFKMNGTNYNLVSCNCADFAARVYANSTGIKSYLSDGSPRMIWRTQALRFAGTKYVPQNNRFQNGSINWNSTEILQTLNPF